MAAPEELLKGIPLFQHLDDGERKSLAETLEAAHFPPGRTMFQEGDPGGVCYIICEGAIELCVTQRDGGERVVAVLGAGEICGELSLLDGGKRSTTAAALVDTDTLVLKREDLIEFLSRRPHAALELLASLANRIRRTDALLKEPVRNPNDLIEAHATLGDRVADMIANVGGSWAFVLCFLSFLLIWILANVSGAAHYDPFPFILLNLALSMITALQAPVIMMSQNRQDAKDRIRSEADHQINVRAEAKIRELDEKIELLRNDMHARKGHW